MSNLDGNSADSNSDDMALITLVTGEEELA